MITRFGATHLASCVGVSCKPAPSSLSAVSWLFGAGRFFSSQSRAEALHAVHNEMGDVRENSPPRYVYNALKSGAMVSGAVHVQNDSCQVYHQLKLVRMLAKMGKV